MDSVTRNEWAQEFDNISERIQSLTYELRDNKDVKEFLQEIERHKTALEKTITMFKKQVQ